MSVLSMHPRGLITHTSNGSTGTRASRNELNTLSVTANLSHLTRFTVGLNHQKLLTGADDQIKIMRSSRLTFA